MRATIVGGWWRIPDSSYGFDLRQRVGYLRGARWCRHAVADINCDATMVIWLCEKISAMAQEALDKARKSG